jgi:hypothetical protein
MSEEAVIFVDIALDAWYRKYPSLEEVAPKTCSCGQSIQWKPFVAKGFVGVVVEDCSCEQTGEAVFLPTDPRIREQWSQILLSQRKP